MSCESLFPLLKLLSFHAISLVVFIAYCLLSITKKTRIPYYDISLYLLTFLAWGAGFYLSDACGIGFGKTLVNISEIMFIGISMSIYMLIKLIYLICAKAAIPKRVSYCLAAAVILTSFLIGILIPGIPE